MEYTAIISLYELNEKLLPKEKKLLEAKRKLGTFPINLNQETKQNFSREIAAEGLNKTMISSLFFDIRIIQRQQTQEKLIFEYCNFFDPSNRTNTYFIDPRMN